MISSRYSRRSSQGIALIIVLAFITLLSVLIVALFSRSSMNRLVAAANASKGKVDILAKSAFEVVVGDLRQEMAAGSTITTGLSVSDVKIMVPLSNKAAVPYANAIILSSSNYNSLVKVSLSGASGVFFSGTGVYTNGDYLPAPNRASNALTTAVSANSRSVPLSRWNLPQLATFSTNITPSWVYVTQGGNVGEKAPGTAYTDNDVTDLRNSESPSYAIGRFAYAIYDEGSLLDINVAGNRLAASENQQRGRLHQADLTAIAVSGSVKLTSPSVFLEWRSASTGDNASSVVGSGGLFDPTRDFITARKGLATSDQTFFGRQDLIAYAKAFQSQFGSNLAVLQALGTFTREKNAPSWFPASGGDAAADINRNLANARGQNNQPIIRQRFPLNRIDLIRQKAAPVQDYFGLTLRPGDIWEYNHGKVGGIYTLDEVRNLGGGREPDFFELLKAAILAGSLGKSPGSSVASTPAAEGYSDANRRLDAHILQIGANIIDQYDADDYPTDLYCNLTGGGVNDLSNRFFGIENLPYLSRVFGIVYADSSEPTKVGGWLQPELWNPHLSGTAPGGSPTALRMVTLGRAKTVISDSTGETASSDIIYSPTITLGAGTTQGQIEFGNSEVFREPKRLFVNVADATSSVAENIISTLSPQPVAIFTGSATGLALPETDTVYKVSPVGSLSFILEYKKPDGNWSPYSVSHGIKETEPLQAVRPINTGAPDQYYVKVDPRTDRFGVSIGAISVGGGGYNETIRTGTGSGVPVHKYPSGTGFTVVTATGGRAYLGLLVENKPGSAMRYEDNDGVVRPADGINASGANGYPLMTASPARPLILNRPFRSVGELGYAFRDLPFKTLDFFSLNSADAGLLDVFSMDDNLVVAGRFNPNTRRREVLQAMLQNIGPKERDSSLVLSESQASAIATAIVNSTRNEPVINRAELVTRLGDIIGNAIPDTAIRNNKTRRESIVRALAEASNTRTWNLMIDLIAQTGRFPPHAVNGTGALNSAFVVQSERRYWLHIAIDRYTGEVVDSQLELVND